MKKFNFFMLASLLMAVVAVSGNTFAENKVSAQKDLDYHRAKWDPIHFKPVIDKATDEQCLACHKEILERKPRDVSPAGLKKTDVLAWYETLNTYEGEQDTFHRRHLIGDYAKKVMNLKCNTCHQGNDPREETAGSSADGPINAVQRKMVDPDTCLMCHGKFPWKQMTGLTGPWTETGKIFGNNCMACHAAFRTNRHQVNFLNAAAIEKEGATNGDVCYGCHGGRSWYRISYPYPRHAWPGMAKDIPDWAKNRPTASQARFLSGMKGDVKDAAPAKGK